MIGQADENFQNQKETIKNERLSKPSEDLRMQEESFDDDI